jgi:hypothetical protein
MRIRSSSPIVGDPRTPHQNLGLAADHEEFNLMMLEDRRDLPQIAFAGRYLLAVVGHIPAIVARLGVRGRRGEGVLPGSALGFRGSARDRRRSRPARHT